MQRQRFAKIVGEVLDSLPRALRERILNVAVLVEDLPPDQLLRQSERSRQLLLGVFHGVPLTKKSVFDLRPGPDYVVLRRTLKQSAPLKPKSGSKSGEWSSTNSATISEWTRPN